MYADDGVLVVGRRYEYAVDILVGEQFAVVVVGGDAVVGLARLFGIDAVDVVDGVLDAVPVDVADRHDAGVGVFDRLGHVVVARDAAGADGADVEPVAGGVLAHDAGGDDAGESQGGGGGCGAGAGGRGHEFPSVHMGRLFGFRCQRKRRGVSRPSA
jgi:hypothetical protein